MIKRVFITIILNAFILSFLLIPVQAAEGTYKTAEIVVDSYGNKYTEKVLINQDNTIFAPITWFLRYGLMMFAKESNQYVFYYVGEEVVKPFAKRIYIDLNGREVNCGCYITETKFQSYMTHKFSGSIIAENTLYLPIEEMLPLFNAKVEITKDGILHINANAVSVFSALYYLNLEEMAFDAERDIIGHELMTASGLLIDTIINFRFDRLDGMYNTGEYNDYRELFKAYLADDAVFLSAYDKERTPAEAYIEDKRNALKEIDGLLSDAKFLPSLLTYFMDSDLYSGFHEFEDLLDDVSAPMESIYKIADYRNTYVNHVDDHLNMLSAVYSREFFGETNPAYKAAVQITSTYGKDTAKQRKEIVHSALYDYVVSEFGGTAVKEFGLTPYKIAFKAVKLAIPGAVEEFGKAAQLGYMDDVVNHTCRVFDKRTSSIKFDTKSLDELRLTAILALVASRHAYNTFWDNYAKVGEIDAALACLYLASESVAYESSDYYANKTVELTKSISTLGVKSLGTIDMPSLKDIFDGSYWHMSFGQSLGYNYIAKFKIDGTFVARSMGSGAYENGTYTYANGKLAIVFDIDGYGYPSIIEYSGNKDGFTSLDKYPMQVGEDYYTMIPDDGSFFGEDSESDPTSKISMASNGEYFGLLKAWDSKSISVELLDYEARHSQSYNYIFDNTGQMYTLDSSKATIWLQYAWGETGNDIKCKSIDDALNTKIWGGSTAVRDVCPMNIQFVVEDNLVKKIVFLYAA